MPQTIRGSRSPLQPKYVTRFDPVRGFIYETVWTCFDTPNLAASIAGLANDYSSLGIQVSLEIDRGIWTLTAEDATQTGTIDNWQLLGNDESTDAFSDYGTLSIINLHPDAMAGIRAGLENNVTADVAFGPGQTPDLTFLANSFVEQIYIENQAGSPDFRRAEYVLRHTTNISNRSGANIADVGVNQIYTTGQLLTECTVGWAFPLPNRMQYKISNIPSQSASPPVSGAPGYLWGWLKSPSTETTTANNRIEIALEYTLELWSLAKYNPKT